MDERTRNDLIKALKTATSDLTQALKWLENNNQNPDKIYNWIGTGTVNALSARNILYEFTSYKNRNKEKF